MGYSKFRNGFQVTSAASIDKRIYLTKEEMKNAESVYLLPDVYIAICPDDGKFYIYNKNNTANSVTGKYRLLEDSIDFTSTQFKANFEAALESSQKIAQVNQEIAEINDTIENVIGPAVTELQENVETLNTTTTAIGNRVTILEPKVTTLETKVGDDNSGLIKRINKAEVDITQAEQDIDQAQTDITNIQTWINNVKLDGGEVKPES